MSDHLLLCPRCFQPAIRIKGIPFDTAQCDAYRPCSGEDGKPLTWELDVPPDRLLRKLGARELL